MSVKLPSFPLTCLNCNNIGHTDTGIYYIPSKKQWFFRKLINEKLFNEYNLVFYCNECYIRRSLIMARNLLCVSCGIYSNRSHHAKIIPESKKIKGDNMTMGDFEFIGDRPNNLKPEGSLCKSCIELLISSDVIRQRIKPQLDFNNIPKHCHQCNELQPEDVVWPLFKNSYKYSYGGAYKLTNNNILSINYPVSICIKCVEQMEHEPILKVKCDQCNSMHQKLYDKRQGVDCDGYISREGISCGYGSHFDESAFLWTSTRPVELENKSLICDSCIQQLLKDGVIKMQ